jgi:hypothetical protein
VSNDRHNGASRTIRGGIPVIGAAFTGEPGFDGAPSPAVAMGVEDPNGNRVLPEAPAPPGWGDVPVGSRWVEDGITRSVIAEREAEGDLPRRLLVAEVAHDGTATLRDRVPVAFAGWHRTDAALTTADVERQVEATAGEIVAELSRYRTAAALRAMTRTAEVAGRSAGEAADALLAAEGPAALWGVLVGVDRARAHAAAVAGTLDGILDELRDVAVSAPLHPLHVAVLRALAAGEMMAQSDLVKEVVEAAGSTHPDQFRSAVQSLIAGGLCMMREAEGGVWFEITGRGADRLDALG